MTPSMFEDWEQWGLGEDPGYQDKMVCDSYMAMMRAASAGLGIAMGFFPITNGWVNKGLLTAPLTHKVSTPYAYWVCSPGNHPHPATEAFFNWAKSLFEQVADIDMSE